MNERAKNTVARAESMLGWPYVFGERGSRCTPSMRRAAYAKHGAEHPTIASKCQVLSGSASSCEGCHWAGCLAFDCRGFTYYLLMQEGIKLMGAGATSQWNTESNWAAKGTIESGLPDLPCCLFKQDGKTMKHTGWHVGGGQIIHCSGEVKRGKVTDKGWTHWGIPAGLYSGEEIKNAGEVTIMPTLKVGSRGQYVVDLQIKLGASGHSVGDIDGVFGKRTEDAVKAFQREHGLDADGICGMQTWAAINGSMPEEDNDPVEDHGDASGDVTVRTVIRDSTGATFYPHGTFTTEVQILVDGVPVDE